MRCSLCGKEVPELQLIESIFEYDHETVVRQLGEDKAAEHTLGTDTQVVCPNECADKLRQNSTVIIRDEPFEGQK